jgi:hypothetical protein
MRSAHKEMNIIKRIVFIICAILIGCSNSNEKETMDQDHIKAHKKSIFHKAEILKSDISGCFYCIKIYSPSEIKDWTDTNKPENQHTALCPYCGIDSVIGSSSGYPITKEFLTKMNRHWF